MNKENSYHLQKTLGCSGCFIIPIPLFWWGKSWKEEDPNSPKKGTIVEQ